MAGVGFARSGTLRGCAWKTSPLMCVIGPLICLSIERSLVLSITSFPAGVICAFSFEMSHETVSQLAAAVARQPLEPSLLADVLHAEAAELARGPQLDAVKLSLPCGAGFCAAFRWLLFHDPIIHPPH